MAGGSDACGQGLQHSGLTASGRPRTGGSSQASPASPERARQGCGPGAPGSAVPGEPGGRKGAPFPLSHGLPEEDQRSARLPGCQARSIKAAGAPRRKGPVCVRETQKPFSGRSARAGGARARGPSCNRAGSQAGGAPPGQKGLSAERRQPGGLGEHKGKLCPCSTQVHLCLRSPSQRKVTEEPAGSPPSSGVWSTGMAKFFLQDAGNSDENRIVLAGLLGQRAACVPIAVSSGQGQGGGASQYQFLEGVARKEPRQTCSAAIRICHCCGEGGTGGTGLGGHRFLSTRPLTSSEQYRCCYCLFRKERGHAVFWPDSCSPVTSREGQWWEKVKSYLSHS